MRRLSLLRQHNNTSVGGLFQFGERLEGLKVKTQSRIFTALFLAFALWFVLPAFAQNPAPAQNQDSDPPGRVARLSYMSGSVSFEPAGENDWSLASLNYPLTSGDRLWTDKDARAELETGNLAIRMAEQSDLTTTSLTDQMVQLGLGQGTVRISAYELRPGNEIEVDTPNAAVTITQAGSYRIESYPDQNRTLVTVNRGEVQVTGNNLNQMVRSGQALELSGTDPVQVSSVSLPPSDSFDQWCNQRDQPYLNARSRQYVSPYVPGYYELDQYGGWETVPDYGPIWYPAGLPVGWCPYRYGRWAWVEPWGWTWVDTAPWGFAPFHYGRWLQVGVRWGWVPGPIAVAPIYGPAFVAFAGGPGFAVSFGGGAVVAWFPLGPGEPFYPWYHHSDAYLRQINVTNVRNINITNITNVTNINNVHYRYQTTAATAVPSNAFRNAENVQRNMVAVKPEQLARAQVIPHPEVNPTPRAIAAGSQATHPPVPAQRPMIVQHAPMARPGQPPVMAHSTPPASHPVTGPPARSEPPSTATAPHPPANNAEVNRGGPPPATAHNAPPPPNTATAPPPRNEPGSSAAAPHPPANNTEVNRGGTPPNPPALVSKYPPPQEKLPYEQKAPAMEQHPGRPLEPQQTQNLHAGKPAGPMVDREVPQHSAPAMHAQPPHAAPPPKH